MDISIPAPARGATHSRPYTKAAALFQFPPLREGRQALPFVSACSFVFQFPPLREGRRMYLAMIFQQIYFNSRPCARGDVIPSPMSR